MATATIISNLGNLQWQGTAETNITESEDTTVTNSSGGNVYYGIGTPSNLLKNNKSKLFKQEANTYVVDFSGTNGGGAQITLTVTGGGPGPLHDPTSSQSQSATSEPQLSGAGASGGSIDEFEVEVKVKVKVKDGKIIES